MKKVFFCMAAIAMLLLSCSSGVDKQKMNADSINAAREPTAQKADNTKYQKDGTRSAFAMTDWDKKILKTADINIETKSYTRYGEQLHKSLKTYGAYIAEENQQLTDYSNRTAIVVKVPVDQFDDLVNSLGNDSAKVLEKKISSEVLTGEITDIQSRVQARKLMRDRYYELLRQAKNMKEILEVQREINALQESIESADGRLSYLQHETAYSTVNLSYFQLTGSNDLTGNPNSYLARVKDAFNAGVILVGDLLIIILHLWPLILTGTFIFLYFKRTSRKRIRSGSLV